MSGHIQTGNVFFESDEEKSSLQEKIEHHLELSLGYDVAVCLRTVQELEKIIASNPFHNKTLTPDTRFAVTFLSKPVKNLLPVPSFTSDNAYELIDMTPNEMFVVWHLKNGRPGNSYDQLGKSLQAQTTTRFWHTTEKILAAAKK